MTASYAPAELETANLRQGKLAYRVAGPPASSTPPVVFVHGVLVDARLWDGVAERLAAQGIRSYAPTLPLGAHRSPMNPDADMTPHGVAQLVLDFIKALDLSNVILVGNDTGGAICQLMLGADTSRIGGVVLTNCDAFDSFPPRSLAPLFQAMRHPGLVAGLVPGLRLEKLRHSPLGYGPLSNGHLDPALTRDWVLPLASKDVRRDLAKFARGVRPRVLEDSAGRFSQFAGPVRILWGADDRMFRTELGIQLSEAFPNATMTTVAAGRTFVPLDYPEEVAQEVIAASRSAARQT